MCRFDKTFDEYRFKICIIRIYLLVRPRYVTSDTTNNRLLHAHIYVYVYFVFSCRFNTIWYSDKIIRVWRFDEDGHAEECQGSPLRVHHYSVQQIVVSPCSSYMASCSLDGTTVIWDLHVSRYTYAIGVKAFVRFCRRPKLVGKRVPSSSLFAVTRL